MTGGLGWSAEVARHVDALAAWQHHITRENSQMAILAAAALDDVSGADGETTVIELAGVLRAGS